MAMRRSLFLLLFFAVAAMAATDSLSTVTPADSNLNAVVADSAKVPMELTAADSIVVDSVAKDSPKSDSLVAKIPSTDTAKTVAENAPQSIEQAILAEPIPNDEMIRRARHLLLRALQSGDRERALQTIEFLSRENSEYTCSFSGMEKGLAFLNAGLYDSALTNLLHERRLFAPEARRIVSNEDRCIAEIQNDNWRTSRVIRDELLMYLDAYQKQVASDLNAVNAAVQNSAVNDFYKEAAPAFLPVIFTTSWGATEESTVRQVFVSGSVFVQKYPMHEDCIWLERNFLKPFQKRLENQVAASEDPVENHLYGKSVGFEFLSGIGFLTNDLKDEFHHKYWNYYVAVPIQLYRIVFTPFISFGWIETRNNRAFSDVLWEKNSELLVYEGGITLGFVAFDSRYMKIEPFAGIASASAELPDNSSDYYYYTSRPNNDYRRLRHHVESNNSIAYLAGVSGEVRLLTVCHRNPNAPLNSISLRVKYMASYLDHDFGYAKMEGVSHKVLAGLGFFIW